DCPPRRRRHHQPADRRAAHPFGLQVQAGAVRRQARSPDQRLLLPAGRGPARPRRPPGGDGPAGEAAVHRPARGQRRQAELRRHRPGRRRGRRAQHLRPHAGRARL
ncbi:MAG: DNA-directed RNA polymerase omega subunit, partial [uncultured Friedmanniella sp.]